MAVPKQRSEPSRADRKAKKRKLEDAIPDLPGDDEPEEKVATNISELDIKNEKKPSKKRKKTSEYEDAKKFQETDERSHKSSKRGRKKNEEEFSPVQIADAVRELVDRAAVKKGRNGKELENEAANGKGSTVPEAEGNGETEEVPRKSKKERKAERKAREALDKGPTRDDDGDGNDAVEKPNVETAGLNDGKDTSANPEEKKRKNNRNREKKRKAALEGGAESKAPRFIAFIGNLPYSATTASLQKHFASVKPKSIRHQTEKDNPQRSKGFAFVEFEGYDHMKTCLKLFHHSMFDDGLSPPRKINVELTGGGGGNSKDRKSKIQSKNQKLNEERVRRIQEEEKAKATKNGVSVVDENSVHPSRRAQVPRTISAFTS